ncbi:MAG: pilin [Granulosicoccus sp.]
MASDKNVKAALRSDQNGYTLIELMIVGAIISVVAVISVPTYQNFKTRAKVNTDLSLARPLINGMVESHAMRGEWPSDNLDAGMSIPTAYKGEYLSSAEISDTPQPGTLTLTYDISRLPVLRGANTLVYYPLDTGGKTLWACDQGTIPDKFRPKKCR